jgi:hypothetical protein
MTKKPTKREIEDIEREMQKRPKRIRRAVNPKHNFTDK